MRWLGNPPRSSSLAAAVALAVVAFAGAVAGAGQAGSPGSAVTHHALATNVQCGDVITTDARLTHDLNNCPADGVVIGAAGVTLDLDGHTIDGTGAGTGVDNTGGYGHVTVKDGRVHQFMDGIRLKNASKNRLSRLTVSLNGGEGIALEASDGNRIERTVASDNLGDGVLLGFDSDANRVSGLTASDNGTSGITVTEGGVGAGASSHTLIERGWFFRNATFGIALEQGSTATQLKRNVAVANQLDGIFADLTSTGALVLGNVANENLDDGIDVENAVALITKNRADRNANLGIRAVQGATDGGGNKAHGNGDPAQCAHVVCS